MSAFLSGEIHERPRSGVFLQSDIWGTFQKTAGQNAVFIGPPDVSVEGAAGVWVVYHTLPFGLRYAYVPRGVVLSKRQWGLLFDYLKKQRCIFARVEPFHTEKLEHYSFVTVRDIQPRATRILDLHKPLQDLFVDMKYKTRYNIRLAVRKGVVVQEADGERGVEVFLKLLHKTAERQGFRPHPDAYYKTMADVWGERVKILVARYEGKVRAALLLLFHKESETVTYLHGASSEKDKEAMAPYAVHWAALRLAQREGYMWYDLWGIVPPSQENKKKHPLAGVSRFKEGFGGMAVEYPGTFEVPFRPAWHRVIRFVRLFRH